MYEKSVEGLWSDDRVRVGIVAQRTLYHLEKQVDFGIGGLFYAAAAVLFSMTDLETSKVTWQIALGTEGLVFAIVVAAAVFFGIALAQAIVEV